MKGYESKASSRSHFRDWGRRSLDMAAVAREEAQGLEVDLG